MSRVGSTALPPALSGMPRKFRRWKNMSGASALGSSLISLSVLTSCATTPSSVEGNETVARAAFRPITWSRKDTLPTIAQIRVHNEVGVELGLWEPPPLPPKPKKKLFHRTPALPPVPPAVAPTAVPLPTALNPPPEIEIVPLPPPAQRRHWWQRFK